MTESYTLNLLQSYTEMWWRAPGGRGGGSVSFIAVNDLTFENAIYHKITFIIFDSI